MTTRTWAEEKVSQAQRRNPSANMLVIAAHMAASEHQRAVRIVKAEIAKQDRVTKLSSCDAEIGEALFKIQVLNTVLAALQRGRTGRGK